MFAFLITFVIISDYR